MCYCEPNDSPGVETSYKTRKEAVAVDLFMGLAAAGGDAASGSGSDSLVITLVGAVVALAMVVPKVFEYIQGRKDKTADKQALDGLAPVLTEITRALHDNAQAYGRLASVLERMEVNNEKALEKVNGALQEHGKLLQGLDYRTKEILKHIERERERSAS